jgi:hypothetical protein
MPVLVTPVLVPEQLDPLDPDPLAFVPLEPLEQAVMPNAATVSVVTAVTSNLEEDACLLMKPDPSGTVASAAAGANFASSDAQARSDRALRIQIRLRFRISICGCELGQDTCL